MLIPSIDLFDGKAVQWRQGKEAVLEESDVFGLLDRFSLYGQVAVIDLNAATGQGDNRGLIEKMLKRHPCRVGGGIRDKATALHYLKAGASKVIIGTAARQPWTRSLPKSSLIFALDSKGDHWLTEGWRQESTVTTETVLDELAPFCSEFLYTQVEKEGMMQGLDRERIDRVLQRSPVPVTVAGGITSYDDIRFLNQRGAHGQIGMALYTGKLSLDEAFMVGLDFGKTPRMPTVVQDWNSGDVLMLAYSTPESLRLALSERRGVYFSRSRNAIWRKGESSGNLQELVHVDHDCDGDTLLFRVRQRHHACHLNRWSCFPAVDRRFSLQVLDKVLAERRETMPAGSFTAQLFADTALRAAKLREETEELIEAASFEENRWEAADLIFFALIEARANGVGLAEIVAELRSRHADR